MKSLNFSRMYRVSMLLLVASLTGVPMGPARATSQAAVQARVPQRQDSFAILHARAFIGDGNVIEDATIVVRAGRIRSVAKGAAAPAGLPTIDAKGGIVTAGLIGADTPLGLSEIELERSTVDTSRDSENPIHAAYQPGPAIFADSSLLPVQLSAGMTNAAVTPSGGLFSGQINFIDIRPKQYGELVVDANAALRARLGQAVQGSRAATIAMLRQALDDAKLYRQQKAAYQRGQLRPLVADGADLEALDPILRGRQRLIIEASRASDILAALAIAKDYNLRIAIVGGQEAWKVAPQIAAAKVPVAIRPTDNLPVDFEQLDARLENAALLHEAGVQVVIADLGSGHNARNIRQQAGIAVAYGLPWNEAIKAMTSNVAQFYGVDDDYGTLEAGKVANIVVWSGDPLEFSSRVEAVYVRGEAMSRQSRQTLLRDRYLDLAPYQATSTHSAK